MELDVRQRFDTFVVGSANRLAAAAARASAESPGAAYNPLYVYGDSGLGKTHLLAAVGQRAKELHPDAVVAFLTADEFVEQLHQAVTSGDVDGFKQRLAGVDVLLLDDVQFLAGRQETQSEMLRLFNALQRSGKQVVLTSDRPPAEIADLDQRLITRFSGGLIVDIGAPDFETRVAILRRRCAERGMEFNPGVVEELSRVSFTNVRELQGALNRLIAYHTLGEGEVTVEFVRDLFRDRGSRPVTPAPQRPRSGAFESFLSGMAVAVAQNIDARRVRLVETMTHWREQGYRTDFLERALEDTESDPEPIIAQYESAIVRLRTLEHEVTALDLSHKGAHVFRDPGRLDEAERLAARLRGESPPPPAPRADLGRADFEVGPSNQFAAHAADAVIEEPGRRYNPLFLHGPAGVGKTHLLHAIGNELTAASGGAMTVACLGASDFVDELIAALQDGTIERWRARYRSVDALLLDDIQNFAGTERAQEELFHLFNALATAGKQVVLASGRAPAALTDLDDRLRSRFEGGLVAEIRQPDRQLREKLFARHLTIAGLEPGAELLAFLSEPEASTVTDVIGTAGRLVEAVRESSGPLTVDRARRVLQGSVAPGATRAAPARAGDPFFLDAEKTVWDWPDVAGRAIEDLR